MKVRVLSWAISLKVGMQLFHTSYYTNFAYRRDGNFDLVSWHLEKNRNPSLPNQVEDFRFNQNVPYTGVGNCPLMRINACAFLHLHLWAIKPQHSLFQKAFRYVTSLFLKPVTALFDAFANTLLLAMKIALIPLISLGNIFQKLTEKKQDEHFAKSLPYLIKNITEHAGVTLTSIFTFTYQTIASVSINFLGPKYDLYCRLGDNFSWSYWIKDTSKPLDEKDELIMDVGRVKYIKEKCGWMDISQHVWKTLCPPLSNPPTANLFYELKENTLHLKANWPIT